LFDSTHKRKMKRAAMDDDSAERYFNNFCTQAPNSNLDLDCLSTETENSENDPSNPNGHSSIPIQTCDKNNIPISIQCSTVNFQSDADNQLAVTGLTATSPDQTLKNNRIVTPLSKDRKRNDLITSATNPTILSHISSANYATAKQHKCYEVLLTKRRANKNKQQRMDMMTNIINTRSESYIPPSMVFSTQFLHWHCKTTAFAEKPRAWSMEQLAETICDFDKILGQATNCFDSFNSKPEHVIQVFQQFMDAITKEAEIMKDELMHSSRAKIGKQKGQNRVQDNLDMTTITNESFDVSNCAYCKHRFIVPIGLQVPEITRHNTKVSKDHCIKMRKWNNTPVKKRGVKPRPEKSLTQQLACICTKMNCLDKVNGSGCFKCESACTNAIEQNSDIRPYFDANFECKCKICICECEVVYFRHEAKKLARQRQIDDEKNNEALVQPKLENFIGFTKSLANLTKEKLYEVGDPEEAMALTAIDLSRSTTLSENTTLRNELQKDIGPLQTSADGRSAAQIRAAKRQRRKANIDKITAAQPLDNRHYFRTIKSSDSIKKEIESPIGKNNNSRWNRNRLYEVKSEDPDNAVVSASSVLTIEANKENQAESLRKKVIKRLIDVNSPKNENKKLLFKMLVKNEENTKMVIEMAIDMGSSVEDTKIMLFNNCI